MKKFLLFFGAPALLVGTIFLLNSNSVSPLPAVESAVAVEAEGDLDGLAGVVTQVEQGPAPEVAAPNHAETAAGQRRKSGI